MDNTRRVSDGNREPNISTYLASELGREIQLARACRDGLLLLILPALLNRKVSDEHPAPTNASSFALGPEGT